MISLKNIILDNSYNYLGLARKFNSYLITLSKANQFLSKIKWTDKSFFWWIIFHF